MSAPYVGVDGPLRRSVRRRVADRLAGCRAAGRSVVAPARRPGAAAGGGVARPGLDGVRVGRRRLCRVPRVARAGLAVVDVFEPAAQVLEQHVVDKLTVVLGGHDRRRHTLEPVLCGVVGWVLRRLRSIVGWVGRIARRLGLVVGVLERGDLEVQEVLVVELGKVDRLRQLQLRQVDDGRTLLRDIVYHDRGEVLAREERVRSEQVFEGIVPTDRGGSEPLIVLVTSILRHGRRF